MTQRTSRHAGTRRNAVPQPPGTDRNSTNINEFQNQTVKDEPDRHRGAPRRARRNPTRKEVVPTSSAEFRAEVARTAWNAGLHPDRHRGAPRRARRNPTRKGVVPSAGVRVERAVEAVPPAGLGSQADQPTERRRGDQRRRRQHPARRRPLVVRQVPHKQGAAVSRMLRHHLPAIQHHHLPKPRSTLRLPCPAILNPQIPTQLVTNLTLAHPRRARSPAANNPAPKAS